MIDSHTKKPKDILRNQRLLRGWSQQKVAEQIGTNEDTVSRWERGERKPSPFYQEKFCILYNMTAEELGFIEAPIHKEKIVPETPVYTNQTSSIIVLTREQQELLFSLLANKGNVISPESGDGNMDISRRDALRQLLGIAGATLILPFHEWPSDTLLHAKQSTAMINNDIVAFFENAMIARWELYYTGGAIRAAHDLDLWMKEITRLSQTAQMTNWHKRALVLLTMSYQLQSCVLRDMMEYSQAHAAYQRAFHVAQELDDPELMSAALARKGVMLIQQERPKEAILYLSGALDTIDGQNLPKLKGHILQGMSEAYAKTHQTQECWQSIEQAEAVLGYQEQTQERSLVRFNAASVAAQKGVDAVLLQDYQNAITLLDRSLTTYDPTLIRGRSRLLAQKAEAYYGLEEIDVCVMHAREALNLAHAVGASKTLTRVKHLHTTLTQSHWRKEQSVAQLSELLLS